MEQQLVTIDASALVAKLNKLTDPATAKTLLILVAHETQNVWSHAVSGEIIPPMTRAVHDQEYLNAVLSPTAIKINGNNASIEPDYVGADRIENGTSPWDMKPAFLGSSNVKSGKDGVQYIDISFKHGTPDQKGSTGFASIIPDDVYEIVKHLGIDDRYESAAQTITKPVVGGMTAPYTHKNSLLDGLKKLQSGNQSQFRTFRRVSSNSDPDSWWNPGMAANPVIEAVRLAMEERLPVIFDAFLAELNDM